MPGRKYHPIAIITEIPVTDRNDITTYQYRPRVSVLQRNGNEKNHQKVKEDRRVYDIITKHLQHQS